MLSTYALCVRLSIFLQKNNSLTDCLHFICEGIVQNLLPCRSINIRVVQLSCLRFLFPSSLINFWYSYSPFSLRVLTLVTHIPPSVKSFSIYLIFCAYMILTFHSHSSQVPIFKSRTFYLLRIDDQPFFLALLPCYDRKLKYFFSFTIFSTSAHLLPNILPKQNTFFSYSVE